jgi:hypothetical protein
MRSLKREKRGSENERSKREQTTRKLYSKRGRMERERQKHRKK